MDFQGRAMVVTGAANGIGAALSRRFHAAGANVVLADRDAAPLERVTQELNDIRPESALGVVADIGTESGNIALINAARAKFGFIDLFYANAGIGGGTDLESTDEAMWEATFNINLNAHRWAAKHLLGEWLAEGRGYFCSTASAAGLLSQIGSAPYSVTKHGAVAFAEWLSITYGDRGVRVSCLCPQGVNTNLLNPPTTGAGSAIAPNGADVVKFAGVVLEPGDVAEVVYQAIVDERFLILPHPEVAIYEQRKAADRDRWLAGMRKLQARVFGTL
ncbi:MAG: SDR family oxidoreductase [Ilumatobacteraceae bacterium]|nr:SDR family oxidoreductase [Ilumatobacteraceae bacterium]